MGFRTKLDYSDNRQIKQRQRTETELSGATTFGVPFSALTTGPNLTTSGETNESLGLVSSFSGNSSLTVFTWTESALTLVEGFITPITSSNSGDTQGTPAVFTANTTTLIDENLVTLSYSGIQIDGLSVTTIGEPSSGIFTGTVSTDISYYSADTLDFTGRTIWTDNTEISRTNKLIIKDGAISGHVFTCVDSEGRGNWQLPSTDIYTTGATLGGAILYFDRTDALSAFSADLSYFLDNTNIYTTGSTAIGNTIYFDRTDLASAYTANLNSLSYLPLSGGTLTGDLSACTHTIFTSAVSGCSNLIIGTVGDVLIQPNGTGNVGINTTAATANLHIAEPDGTSATTVKITNANKENAVLLFDIVDSSSSGTTGEPSNIALAFCSSGSDKWRVGMNNWIPPDGSGIVNDYVIANGNEFDNDYVFVIERDTQNFGFNTYDWGASSANVLGIGNGTAPTTNITNQFHFWAEDIVAGNSAPHFKTEAGDTIKLYEHAVINTFQGLADSLSDIGLLATGSTITGNTSGTCLTDLHVTNIHSCSPLFINPLDEGNVYIGSSSAFTFDLTTGFMGIGDITTPTELLHLGKNQNGLTDVGITNDTSGTLSGARYRLESGGCAGAFSLFSPGYTNINGFANNIVISSSEDCDGVIISTSTQTINDIKFGWHDTTSGFTEQMRLDVANGFVGINTDSPAAYLHVSGSTIVDTLNIDTVGAGPGVTDLGVDAGGNVVDQASDRKLKENIKTIDNALDKVLKLRGVSYQWKDKQKGGDAVRLGFIAQEVEDVVPELAYYNPNGDYMGVHYKETVALLVEAIKELSSGDGIINNSELILETQTIAAEDNNIELNFDGNHETAINGGISIIDGISEGESSEFKINSDGDWVTNNNLIPKGLVIPEYTPESSDDDNGTVGNITRDDEYLYVKRNNSTWGRIKLENF
jgi:hypothetical protein